MSEQQERPPAVAVYARVSCDDQKRKGTIENQLTALDRYVTAHGITPYGWYEDEAISGKWVPFPERPAAQRLLADISAGHLNTILVSKLDRFGRNAREILNAVHDLNAAGAQLVSIKENVDTRTSAGRFFLTVLAGVAELEYDFIMERTELGRARCLGDGGWMGGQAPYGYRVEGKEQNARLVLDDTPLGIPEHPSMTAADVVRLIYRLAVEENRTCLDIADRLNAMDVPTAFIRRGLTHYRRTRPSGAQRETALLGIWRPKSVQAILSNPVYKGLYTFGRRKRHNSEREIVTCPVPALVDEATWDAARTALARRLTFSARNAKRDYLLRGMMTCGRCGHKYIGDDNRYVCYAHRRPTVMYGRALASVRRCQSPSVGPAKRIEAEIWAGAEGAIRNPGPTLAKLHAKLTGQADASEMIRAQFADKQREQAAKQSERDIILEYFREGRIAERDVDRQLDYIAREEAQIASEIAALMRQLSDSDAATAKLERAATLLAELRDKLDEGLSAGPLTPAFKRSVIETLVIEMVVHEELDEATGKLRALVRVRSCYDPEESAGIVSCATGPSTAPC